MVESREIAALRAVVEASIRWRRAGLYLRAVGSASDDVYGAASREYRAAEQALFAAVDALDAATGVGQTDPAERVPLPSATRSVNALADLIDKAKGGA